MPEPTRKDLLDRYEALQFASRSLFEAKHNLPRNLIGKLYQGAYYSALAGPTIKRFEDAVYREEQGLEPAPGVAMGRPRRIDPANVDQAAARATLSKALVEAESLDDLERSTRDIQVALLACVVTDKEAQVLQGLAGERRQQLKAKAEAEERAKDGSEMLIRVIYVPNWTGGPLPS